MGLSILQGYVSGKAPIHDQSFDPRFVGLDHSEMLEALDKERMGSEICVTQKPDCECNSPRRQDDSVTHEGQLALPGSDFREIWDEPELKVSCLCRMQEEASEICPACGHPALYEYEVCLCRAVSVELFDQMQCKTKRKAIALSVDGTALSSKFCAVIIHREELMELVIQGSVSQGSHSHLEKE